MQKGSSSRDADVPDVRYTPPLVASRYSESPVSDFEDGYSLYRDCLEQVCDKLIYFSIKNKFVTVRMDITTASEPARAPVGVGDLSLREQDGVRRCLRDIGGIKTRTRVTGNGCRNISDVDLVLIYCPCHSLWQP